MTGSYVHVHVYNWSPLHIQISEPTVGKDYQCKKSTHGKTPESTIVLGC